METDPGKLGLFYTDPEKPDSGQKLMLNMQIMCKKVQMCRTPGVVLNAPFAGLFKDAPLSVDYYRVEITDTIAPVDTPYFNLGGLETARVDVQLSWGVDFAACLL